MKKSFLCALMVSCALTGATLASAAYAASEQIAVVNIQQIMRDSTAAKSVREQLESKQKSFQSEITAKQNELQKEEQALGKKQSVLSKSAFEEQTIAFRGKVTDAQKEVAGKKALLDNAFERSLNDIQKAVTGIIADMAKDKGFEVAIPTSQILYAEPKLDISNEVLEQLNKKLPSLNVTFDSDASKSSRSQR